MYTQPQLFACLVLKTYLGLDYRRFHGLLEDCPELVRSIGMDGILKNIRCCSVATQLSS